MYLAYLVKRLHAEISLYLTYVRENVHLLGGKTVPVPSGDIVPGVEIVPVVENVPVPGRRRRIPGGENVPGRR